ncbi:MAG: hypothetical protein D3M94_15710 [Rhodocyclales bacterium GT-UBC]|nr:MAG: hypothetical protein D3M94_15710 [Rhodocyclales bacterium GT-UBC]
MLNRDLPPAGRLPLLLFGMLSLVGGSLAGLTRLGWPLPAASAAGWHGALMISAFFGTVISLERAVALGRSWAYLAPACAGSAGLVLLAGGNPLVPQILCLVAAGIMLVASAVIMRRQAALFTVTLAIAVACWLGGNLYWLLDTHLLRALPWWLSFLVLTIAGERLELTRFLPTPPRARLSFMAITAALLAANVISSQDEHLGLQLFAAALFALALWLLRYDIARRNARLQGLPRFIALCLLSGYAWLAAAGLIGLAGGLQNGHTWRDAALHCIGLGFVFAMVFGHAPVIFPAVTRIRIPFHASLYIPLILLHISLGLRILGGLGGHDALRQWGGLFNGLVLLSFVATLLMLIRRNPERNAP